MTGRSREELALECEPCVCVCELQKICLSVFVSLSFFCLVLHNEPAVVPKPTNLCYQAACDTVQRTCTRAAGLAGRKRPGLQHNGAGRCRSCPAPSRLLTFDTLFAKMTTQNRTEIVDFRLLRDCRNYRDASFVGCG